MAYEKRTLVDGETIVNKELLDHMQDGIIEAQKVTSKISSDNDITLTAYTITEQPAFVIRCPDFSDTLDLVWYLSYGKSSNKQLNIQTLYTTSSNTKDASVYVGSSSLTLWKNSADDTAPIEFNGSYIGGNHGPTVVQSVTVASHDKTEADIGSIWKSKSYLFMLVKIVSDTNLWFVQTNNSDINSGDRIKGANAPSTSLVHESGATNTTDITIESNKTFVQLQPAINHMTLKAYVDREEIDITNLDSTKRRYKGKTISLVNEYDIIYVPAMLNYLQANVGKNTNESYYSEDINGRFCRMRLVHEIHPNGSMNVYQTIKFDKNVSLATNYITQCQTFTDGTVHKYIPNSKSLQAITPSTKTQTFVTIDDYAEEDVVPYRYYAFATEELEKGYAVIFDRAFGAGTNEKRLARNTQNVGGFESSDKLYPRFASNIDISAGTVYDGCAVRIPFTQRHPDLTAFVWYWRGDDIILCIDSHKQVNLELTLPDYMAGTKVEILDKTDSVITEPAYIWEDSKLNYATNADYGYLVLRLYK